MVGGNVVLSNQVDLECLVKVNLKSCHKWINLTEGNQDPATEEPFCLSPISYCLKEFGLEAYIREKLLLKIAFYLKNSFAWQGKYLIIKYLLFL